MAKPVILTSDGLANLEKELEELKTVKRKDIADKIKVAISFGDLSENSEYDEAKNEQAMIEARILQIEAMLKNVKILDTDELNTENISVGSKVKVKDLEFGDEEIFHIVEMCIRDRSRRLLDFLSGVAFANNGEVKRVANSTFIITPSNVNLMGDLLDELENSGVYF